MPGAREIAYLSLERCEKQKKYSNLEIDSQVKRYGLKGAEKSLYVSLMYGVTERLLTLDFIIGALSSRPLEKLDARVLIPLRLGLYQLIFMDRIPESAAVDESVKIANVKSKRALGGFVNAILRSYQRALGGKRTSCVGEILSFEPFKSRFEALGEYARLSVKYSYPEWLVKMLSTAYSADCATKIMSFQNESRGTSFRVNTLKANREKILSLMNERGISVRKTEFSPFGIYCESIEISLISDLLDNGEIFVQDEASQLASLTLGATPESITLDCCACPGGKSFSSAILMENRGRVISCDLHESKLSLIESGAKRLGIDIITTQAADSSVYNSSLIGENNTADFVLCDVPCSGLGVIAKKPEIRYKDKSDLERLPDIGLKILKNCSGYVRPGGTLVYSTCTLNPEENENNIKRFLENNDLFEPVEFNFTSDDGRMIESTHGILTLFPHIHGTDGFFIAKMKRKI
ncbi:MAG: 16S rRNA (cytosine(967)-C(5))-methyltransferase RsmB [Clostridia bacterium]|nr:16S rRNA (cytosine(967)-C(5))-methyltransferase RsmB [Clostridia bacterium]